MKRRRGGCQWLQAFPGTPFLPRPSVSNRHSHSIDQHLRLTVIHLVITLVAELKGRN